jgi:deoxyadenosine/deoxycytidine kinase/NTP pyrophosphatase (non-canonical NTP hydrolase)
MIKRPVGTLLRDLQQLQQRFDTSRGFDFGDGLETLSAKSRETLLVQFIALALSGEVGELANDVKKVVRARLLGSEHANWEQASGELGDILAYLLKMANVLQDDLVMRYLLQMCENALRFPAIGDAFSRVITLVGPSGAGKSTAVAALAAYYRTAKHYLEEPSNNPHLSERIFAASGDVAAYQSQHWFMSHQESFVASLGSSDLAIIDQDPAAITLIYSRMLWERKILSAEQFEGFLKRLLDLEIDLGTRLGNRTMILLDADPKVLWQRARQRMQGQFDVAWFANLRERFLRVYGNAPGCILLPTDSLSPAGLLKELVSIVDKKIRVQKSGAEALGGTR